MTVDPNDLRVADLGEFRSRHQAVLMHNVRDFMVTPSDELYGADGNNWGYLWDTMFAVMAIAADDAPLAGHLLQNYLTSQHRDGMVPHMTMWSSSRPQGWLVTNTVWHAYRTKGRDLHGHRFLSSPITQPPLMAQAARTVADRLPDDASRHAFAQEVVPRLIAHHEWLYRERELTGDGLVVTVHPHETGRDDAPSHVDLLHGIRWSLREKVLLSPIMQATYQRCRTDIDPGRIDIDERSATDTMLRAAYLAMFDIPRTRRTMRRYHLRRYPFSHPYLHFDPGFNAIFDDANDELIRLAEIAEIELRPELLDAMTRTQSGQQRFWDSTQHGFRGIDGHGVVTFRAGQEIGDLLPLYSSHITPEQADAVVDLLNDHDKFGGPNLPTVNRSSPHYSPDQFWRGPAWPPTTDLILRGLQKRVTRGGGCAADPVAARVRDTAARLGNSVLRTALTDEDLPEYRDSRTGAPKGARQFSWTAALTTNVLELLGPDALSPES
jgi:hypothetical protein